LAATAVAGEVVCVAGAATVVAARCTELGRVEVSGFCMTIDRDVPPFDSGIMMLRSSSSGGASSKICTGCAEATEAASIRAVVVAANSE
jgi:hypothetical protein